MAKQVMHDDAECRARFDPKWRNATRRIRSSNVGGRGVRTFPQQTFATAAREHESAVRVEPFSQQAAKAPRKCCVANVPRRDEVPWVGRHERALRALARAQRWTVPPLTAWSASNQPATTSSSEAASKVSSPAPRRHSARVNEIDLGSLIIDMACSKSSTARAKL